MSKGRNKELGRAYSDGLDWGYTQGRNDGYDYALMVMRRIHKLDRYLGEKCEHCDVEFPCPTVIALESE